MAKKRFAVAAAPELTRACHEFVQAPIYAGGAQEQQRRRHRQSIARAAERERRFKIDRQNERVQSKQTAPLPPIEDGAPQRCSDKNQPGNQDNSKLQGRQLAIGTRRKCHGRPEPQNFLRQQHCRLDGMRSHPCNRDLHKAATALGFAQRLPAHKKPVGNRSIAPRFGGGFKSAAVRQRVVALPNLDARLRGQGNKFM